MTFYKIETLPSSAPTALHPSGKKEKIIDNLIQRAIGTGGRVKDNKLFSAQVLYISLIPEAKFRQKFWPDIVQYIIPGPMQSKKIQNKRIVAEAIVYIPELCATLPRPPDTDAKQFFSTLRKFYGGITGEGMDALTQSIPKDLKKIKNAERYFNMIKRFPRAYMSLGEGSESHTIMTNSIIPVKFPYEYDTSVGVVVKQKA